MSQKHIFELLSKNLEKSYDFPDLQPECVEIFSENVADIVYETLKQKSVASGEKRRNILGFVHNLCITKEAHSRDDSYKVFVRNLKVNHEADLKSLIESSSEEIEKISDLSERIIQFHRKKNLREKEKVKKLEFSKNFKQDVLRNKFDLQFKNEAKYYETDEEFIKNLLRDTSNIKNDEPNQSKLDFREKQIKMCYGLINLNSIEDISIINDVLNKLENYERLEKFEVNFLKYLLCMDHNFFDFTQILIDKFFFVIEKIILQYCTEIIQLMDETEVCNYFLKIEQNKNLLEIRKKCMENELFRYKVKNMLHSLYFCSFCNENIMRFLNFFE